MVKRPLYKGGRDAEVKTPKIEQKQEGDLRRRVSVSGVKKPVSDIKESQATVPQTVAVSGATASDLARKQQLRQLAVKAPENKKAFNKFMDTARMRTGTITKAGLQTKAGVETILDSWAAHNDKLYVKGNFLTPAEKAAWLKEVQDNPFLAYDITGVKGQKPPENFEEALARLEYMVSEITLGGAREMALPMSMKAGEPRRVEDAILQITGGLLTPSPTDYVVSQAFRSLASLGKKGSRILKKVMNGVELTSDEARQFEKLVGQYGYSTSDLRKAGSKLDDLTNAEWDELLKKYQKYYEFWEKNPELYGSGAAYKPSALLEFEDVLDDLGYDTGEYIDYLKKYKLGPTMNPATLIAFINGVPPPKADLKAYEKISSDLDKYRESLKQTLKEATEEELVLGPTERTKLKKDPQMPGYTPAPVEEVEEEEEGVTIIQVPRTRRKGKPKPDTIIEPVPVLEEEEEQKTVTVAKTEVDTGVEETTREKGKSGVEKPPGRLPRGKDLKPNVFRALVGGLKEEYRITFDYPKGKSESFTVTARSFPLALSKATPLRRVKYVPSEVDIVKAGKPRK